MDWHLSYQRTESASPFGETAAQPVSLWSAGWLLRTWVTQSPRISLIDFFISVLFTITPPYFVSWILIWPVSSLAPKQDHQTTETQSFRILLVQTYHSPGERMQNNSFKSSNSFRTSFCKEEKKSSKHIKPYILPVCTWQYAGIWMHMGIQSTEPT